MITDASRTNQKASTIVLGCGRAILIGARKCGRGFRELVAAASFFLGLLVATTSRAEVGDICPPISLDQPFNHLAARYGSFLPTKSMLHTSETCVSDMHFLMANYGPICSIQKAVDVVIATAIGSPNSDRLRQLTIYANYSHEGETQLRANLHGSEISLTEYAKRLSSNSRKTLLYPIDNGASHALLTEEVGPMALSDKYFFVIRVFPANEDGSLLKSIQTCKN
jgi:hypothetical protein